MKYGGLSHQYYLLKVSYTKYIIMDQSQRDGTSQIIEKVKDDFGLNIKDVIDHNPDYVVISDRGLKHNIM